ncbi:hypothetical protein AAG906_030877 [Vitis piasezkii]
MNRESSRKRRGRKSKERKKKGNSAKNEDLESTVNEELDRTINQEDLMKKHTPPPFLQALHGKKGINNVSKILEVSTSSICARNNSIQKKKKDHKRWLPEPSDLLATLPPLKMRKEILHLFNGKETQEAVKEEPPKLIL